VPDLKNRTINQPMMRAAAIRIRILAFLERGMKKFTIFNFGFSIGRVGVFEN